MENIIPSREASIFCVEQEIQESPDHNMSEMTINCENSSEITDPALRNDSRLGINEASEMSNLNNRQQGNVNFSTNATNTSVIMGEDGLWRDNRLSVSNNATTSVIMGEDGGMYQCFPISEREMFIVSLDDHPNLIARNSGNPNLTVENLGNSKIIASSSGNLNVVSPNSDNPDLIISNPDSENELIHKENQIIDSSLGNSRGKCAESFPNMHFHSKTSGGENYVNTESAARGENNLNIRPMYEKTNQHITENERKSMQSKSEKINFHVLNPGAQDLDHCNKFEKFVNNDQRIQERIEKPTVIINSKYIEKNMFVNNDTKDNYIINYKDSKKINKGGISVMQIDSSNLTETKQTSVINSENLDTLSSTCNSNRLTYQDDKDSFISTNYFSDIHSTVTQATPNNFQTLPSSNNSQPISVVSQTQQPSHFNSHITEVSALTSNALKEKSQVFLKEFNVSQDTPSTSKAPLFASITRSSSKSLYSTQASLIPKDSSNHKLNANTNSGQYEIIPHFLPRASTLMKVSNISHSSSLSTQDDSNPTEFRNPPVLEWYKCHICFEVLPSSSTLRHHFIHQHQLKNIEAHVCFLCSMECLSLAQLECHLRIHHGVRNAALTCHICGTQLASSTECRAHTRKHEQSLSCPLCEEKFYAQHQILGHVRDFHLARCKPHVCIVCGKRFKHNSTLKLHKWRHAMQSCPQENCTLKAVDESWLVEHMQKRHTLLPDKVSEMIDQRDQADKQADELYTNYKRLCQEKDEVPEQIEMYSKHFEDIVGNQFFQNGESNKRINQTEKETQHYLFQKYDLTINSFLNEESGNYSGFNNETTQQVPVYIDPEVNTAVESLVGSILEFEEKSNKDNQIITLNKEKNKIKIEETEEELIEKILRNESRVYRCGLCNIYLASATDLEKHKITHEQVSCTICSKSFLSRKLMRRHLATHAGQENKNRDYPFTCLECQKSFSSKSALSKHERIHLKSLGRFQCPECKRRIKTRACLTEHLARVHKIYSENAQYPCSICERKFTSQVYLEQHMLRHEGDSSALWNCNKCEQRFQRPKALHKHLANHDKIHHCPNCSKQFTHIKKLTTHMRTHQADLYEKHECIECNLKFSYKSQLLIHIRTHTDERPYVCEICGKRFKRLQHCQVHFRIAHRNIKNVCPECQKTFTDKDNLMRHRLMVHYKLKRWICGICALHYAYPQDLRNHLKKQHNWVLDRVQGTNKKSRDQPVVVPKLGDYQISAEVKHHVMKVYEEVSRKIRHLVDSQTVILKNVAEDEDPDDPVQDEGIIDSEPEVKRTVRKVKEVDSKADIDNQSVLTDISSDAVVGCGSGGETMCVICQVSLCCEKHMEVHMVKQHRLRFQCSICGLNYASQQLCVDHVATQHTNHVLALQAGNLYQQSGFVQLQGSTGISALPNIITQQHSAIVQDNNSSIIASTSAIPSQICLVQQENGELMHCLVQSQASQQVPILIRQQAAPIVGEPSVKTTFAATHGAIGGLGTVLQLNSGVLPIGGVLGQQNMGQMTIIGGQVMGNQGNVVGGNQQQGLYLTTGIQNTPSVVGGNSVVLQYSSIGNLGSSLSLVPTLPTLPVAATPSAVAPCTVVSADHSVVPPPLTDTHHQTHTLFKLPKVIESDVKQRSLCKSPINITDTNTCNTFGTKHAPNIPISEYSKIPSASKSSVIHNEYLTSDNDKELQNISLSEYQQNEEPSLHIVKEENNLFQQPEKAPFVFDSLHHGFENSKHENDQELNDININKKENSKTSHSQTAGTEIYDSTAGALLTLAETCSNSSSVVDIHGGLRRNHHLIECNSSYQINKGIQNKTESIMNANNITLPFTLENNKELITSTFNRNSDNLTIYPIEIGSDKSQHKSISDHFDSGKNIDIDTQTTEVLEDSSKHNPKPGLVVEIIQTKSKNPKDKTAKSYRKIRKKSSANYNFWRNQSEAVARGLNKNRSLDGQSTLRGEPTVCLGYQCVTCGKIFKSSIQLDRHGKTHREKRFPCEECGKTFTENFNLKTHMITHTKERPHQCSFCSKSFRYLRDLNDHKKIHQGIRPHECKECQRTFVRRRELLRHARELHGNQRYKCHVCGQTFLRKVYLETVHMPTHYTHENGAKYTCIVCKKEFKSAETLKEHSIEHGPSEKESPHLCGVCGRIFSKARYLTAHLRVHHKRKNYLKCSFCPRMFRSEITLKSHEDAFHINPNQSSDKNKPNLGSRQEQEEIMQGFSQVQANDKLSQNTRVSNSIPNFELEGVSIITAGDHSVLTGQHMLSNGPNSVSNGHISVTSDNNMLSSGHNLLPSGHNLLPSGHNSVPSGHNSVPTGQHISTTGYHVSIDGQHLNTSVDQYNSHQIACLNINESNMPNSATINVTNISNTIPSFSITNANNIGTISSTSVHNYTSNNIHVSSEGNSIDYFTPSFYSPSLLEKQT